MKKNGILKHLLMLTLSLSILMISSCGDDEETDPVTDAPNASFTFTVDEANFLKVSFINVTSNGESYSWDFGDGTTSTEMDPIHEYTAAGKYTVVLTATNSIGSDDFTAEVTITDPDAAAKLLTGETSKTWKLRREGTSMLLASSPEMTEIYWEGNSNNGTRPCLYDDSFTFGADGSYVYNDGGTYWAEYGAFNNVADCDQNTAEGCYDPTVTPMTNACGDDVSAWGSGSHTFEYNASTGKITLTGTGAWIGIPKLATDGEVITPQSSVTFDAVLVPGGESGVDTLYASFNYDGAFWPITYVSYADPSIEPAIVSVSANFSAATNGLEVTFANTSSGATSYSWSFGDGGSSTDESPVHTYAAEGTYSVTLTASDAGGSAATVTKDVVVTLVKLTDPAPTPTKPEGDVMSIYSDTYTSIGTININPNWGQKTVTSEVEVVTGDKVVKMEGLDYQGVDFGGAFDISSKTKVHIDVWTASSETFNFVLISDGPQETPYSITTTGGQWDSFDVALSEYTSVVDLTKVIQFKFDATTKPTIYYDNIYFH